MKLDFDIKFKLFPIRYVVMDNHQNSYLPLKSSSLVVLSIDLLKIVDTFGNFLKIFLKKVNE